ncbi:MAG: ATP-binding cassette domain-containing protein [Bergeyella sp.]|nr:ATP-binding cassette domain-containing protein [Bergeyella sp.]
MIEIQNISKNFTLNKKKIKALDGIQLSISEGDIVGIIGSSGAGKSTLIRCINLLEKPDKGNIVINGKNLVQLSTRSLALERKKIGMIFQHFNLLSSRTVFENVSLPLEFDHIKKQDIEKKVSQLLGIVGLKDKANEYPKNLSGGQKQRVAIARSLANDPHLLLCDEATSALDPASTLSILQLIRDINKRLKITVVLITHEMEVVKSICNHIAVIDKGKLVTKGSLEEVLKFSHPTIEHLSHSRDINIPQEIYKVLSPHPREGLHTLLKTELDGKYSFSEVLDFVSKTDTYPYQLIKVEIETLGNKHMGKMLVKIKIPSKEIENTVHTLENKKINHSIEGYV